MLKAAQSQDMLVSHQTYSGPLPEPGMLEQYKNADPSFPERIVRMAEDHNAADIITKKRFSLANLITPILGQVFAFLLGIAGIIAGAYLTMEGHPATGIVVIGSAFSPIIISSFKRKKDD